MSKVLADFLRANYDSWNEEQRRTVRELLFSYGVKADADIMYRRVSDRAEDADFDRVRDEFVEGRAEDQAEVLGFLFKTLEDVPENNLNEVVAEKIGKIVRYARTVPGPANAIDPGVILNSLVADSAEPLGSLVDKAEIIRLANAGSPKESSLPIGEPRSKFKN